MTAILAPAIVFKDWDGNGQPLAFGTVGTYQAGTLVPQATYVDSTQTTPNTNPIQLNNRGEANIWLDPLLNYKFIVLDSAGRQIRVVDQIQGSLTYSQLISILTQSFIGSILYPILGSEVGVIANQYPYYDTRRYDTFQHAHDSLPSTGGRVTAPPGVLSFSSLVVTKPMYFEGAGDGIGAANVSPTQLSCTGSGISIDLQDGGGGAGARGSYFRGAQLVNAGTCTIGVRVNSQDTTIALLIQQTTSGTAGFSVAGIRVGDVNQVNNFQDHSYIRQQPALGIDLWNVSEGTLTTRLIQNGGYQLKVGDTASGSTCNGLNLANGFSPQTANSAGSGGIKIERSAFKLSIYGAQFETDVANGTKYAIDAAAAVVCDMISVQDTFFNGASWTTAAAFAINVNLASTYLNIGEGVEFLNFGTAAIKNTSAALISLDSGILLSSCPLVVDVFSTAVQQYTGTFTPTVLGSSTAGVTTYTTQNGTFNRDGHRVSFRIRVVWTGQTGTGNLLVGSLPLSAANTEDVPISVVADNLTFANQLVAYVSSNSTLITLATISTGAARAAVPLDTAAGLWLSGTYFV